MSKGSQRQKLVLSERLIEKSSSKLIKGCHKYTTLDIERDITTDTRDAALGYSVTTVNEK